MKAAVPVQRLAMLDVALAVDVQQLLATRLSERGAVTAGVPAEGVAEVFDRAAVTAVERLTRWTEAVGRDVGERVARERRLLERRERHLDGLRGDLAPEELDRGRGRDGRRRGGGSAANRGGVSVR